MDEYSFLNNSYQYPFTFRGVECNSVEEAVIIHSAPSRMGVKVRKEAIDKGAAGYMMGAGAQRPTSLVLCAMYSKFKDPTMSYRLGCITSLPPQESLGMNSDEYKFLALLHRYVKSLEVEMTSNSYSLDVKEESHIDGTNEVSTLVADSIMGSLGITTYDTKIREVVVLGAWSIEEYVIVCSITRPRVSNVILSVFDMDMRDIENMRDMAMAEMSPGFTSAMTNPIVQQRGNGHQVMGCAGQFVYSYLPQTHRHISTVHTADSVIYYTVVHRSMDTEVYRHTEATNLILQTTTSNSVCGNNGSVLDIYMPHRSRSYKLHIGATGNITSVSDVARVGELYKALSDGISIMFDTFPVQRVLNTLKLIETLPY